MSNLYKASINYTSALKEFEEAKNRLENAHQNLKAASLAYTPPTMVEELLEEISDTSEVLEEISQYLDISVENLKRMGLHEYSYHSSTPANSMVGTLWWAENKLWICSDLEGFICLRAFDKYNSNITKIKTWYNFLELPHKKVSTIMGTLFLINRLRFNYEDILHFRKICCRCKTRNGFPECWKHEQICPVNGYTWKHE